MKKKYSQLLSFIILIILNLLFLSCSKDDSESNSPDDGSYVSENIEIYENVKVIDSTKFSLNQTPEMLDAGTYEFTSMTATGLTINSGDVIVGEQGDGFIRKVTAISLDGNIYTLTTTQGSMSDVFKTADFGFTLNMDSMERRASTANGFNYSFGDISLGTVGVLDFKVSNGNINFNPNWKFDFSFRDGPVKFKMLAKDATLNGSFKFTASASEACEVADITSSIKKREKPFTFYVPAVILGIPVRIPVKGKISVDLLLHRSLSVSAALSRSATFSANNTFTLGLIYENDTWSAPTNINQNNTVVLGPRVGNANLNVKMGLTPKVSVTFYKVAGPYASIGLEEEFDGNLSTTDDWDLKADVWLKSVAGFAGKILGNNFNFQSNPYESEKLSYITPYSLEIVSGNNQNGAPGNALQNPLKVRVKDINGNPESNVKVYFQSLEGLGSVSPASALTDANGIAQTTWTLGSGANHRVSASVRKADGSNILNAPQTFYATVGNSIIGTWAMESFINDDGPVTGQSLPVGSYVTLFTASGCASIVTRYYTIESQTYVIDENNYSYTEVYKEKHTNVTWNNCTILSDGADTITTYNETGSGQYIYDGTIYSATPTGEVNSQEFVITFLTPNKISIGGNIYNRQ